MLSSSQITDSVPACMFAYVDRVAFWDLIARSSIVPHSLRLQVRDLLAERVISPGSGYLATQVPRLVPLLMSFGLGPNAAHIRIMSNAAHIGSNAVQVSGCTRSLFKVCTLKVDVYWSLNGLYSCPHQPHRDHKVEAPISSPPRSVTIAQMKQEYTKQLDGHETCLFFYFFDLVLPSRTATPGWRRFTSRPCGRLRISTRSRTIRKV
jgi:hypothetical protein